MSAPHLLVVFHVPSPGTQRLADALVAGCSAEEVAEVAGSVELRVRTPFEVGPDDLRWADGVVLGTTENFGYMSGALKDFFDRTYYQVIDETPGLPYALVVKGRFDDGSGTVAAVTPITTGLRWREVQPPTLVIGEVTDEALERVTELGMTVAAGLASGLW